MLLDRNARPFTALDSYNVSVVTPTAFAGGTTDARGDDGGTNDPFTLYNVTGDVLVRMYGVCTVDLVSAGGGTLAVGVTGNTGKLIASSTATDIDASDIWLSATVTDVGAVALASVTGPFLVVNGLDIIESVGTADITAGNIYYVCLWRPLSYSGNVVNAV